MKVVKLSDVVVRANTKEDRKTTTRIYYAAGEQVEPQELLVRRKGIIAEADLGPMFYFGFKSGQVLLPSRSFESKKAAVATYDGICSEKTFVLETKDPNVLLQEYLVFIIQNELFWQYAEENKSGSVNFFLNWSAIANYEFTLPSLDEQKVLADKLWAAYRVKESYKKLLAAIDDMLKAKFIEMFGEDEKNKVPLHTVCETLIDGDWIESKDQSDSGVRLIQTGNIGVGEFKNKEDKSRFISQDTFDRLNCTEIFPGDILISRLPDPIGRACILPKYLGKSITAVDCTIIRLNDKMLPEFFIANTLSNYYNQQILSGIKGTTRLRISRRDLSLINILCPPLPLQQEFVAIATQAEATKESLRKSIENIDQVIKSLINQ